LPDVQFDFRCFGFTAAIGVIISDLARAFSVMRFAKTVISSEVQPGKRAHVKAAECNMWILPFVSSCRCATASLTTAGIGFDVRP